MDVGVRDRDDAGVGGDRHLVVGGADELAGERRVAVVRARACARGAAAEEAAEVVGLGQRALGARRGDLERVALADRRELVRDALAQVERDAVGMVDEQAHACPPTTSASSTSTSGSASRERASMSVWMRLIGHLLCHEKSGRAPTFRRLGPARTAKAEESVIHRPGPWHGRGRRSGFRRGRGPRLSRAQAAARRGRGRAGSPAAPGAGWRRARAACAPRAWRPSCSSERPRQNSA